MSSSLEKLLVSLGSTYRRHREKLNSIIEKARVVAGEMGYRAVSSEALQEAMMSLQAT